MILFERCRNCANLHDHLATTEEGVADELARTQGNVGVRHDEGTVSALTVHCEVCSAKGDFKIQGTERQGDVEKIGIERTGG